MNVISLGNLCLFILKYIRSGFQAARHIIAQLNEMGYGKHKGSKETNLKLKKKVNLKEE